VERAVAWELEAGAGLEVAFVRLDDRWLRARGAALRAEPEPYSLHYTLVTARDFVTSSLAVSTSGLGWWRHIALKRSADGGWTCRGTSTGKLDGPAPGCEPGELSNALDCDLGLSPLTNTMPVLRHGLLSRGGPMDLVMAWVSVPDLLVVPSRQRYEFVRRDGDRSVVRYGGGDRGTAYDIVFDGDGLVIEYPGLARRVNG
jgi:hypothetical protein